MSVRHPNISAWQRDPHEGHYSCELGGLVLTVRWKPNTPEERGSFYWESTRAGGKPQRSHDHYEELEAAMADAEEHARHRAARVVAKPAH
jgi:hypothetical protein